MIKFKNINTGEIVSVLNQEDNFYVLNSGQRIDKTLFLSGYTPIETNTLNEIQSQNMTQPNNQVATQQVIQQPSSSINPDDFFATKPSIQGADKIKNFNTQNMVDVPKGQETTVTYIDDGETNETPALKQRKQELIKQYNTNVTTTEKNVNSGFGSSNIDINDDVAIKKLMNQSKPNIPERQLNENGLTKQQEFLRQQQIELTGNDPMKDKINKFRSERGLNPTPIMNTDSINTIQQQQPQQSQQIQQEDEVIRMYRKFKRNTIINLTLKIKDKIGKPEFIQMMAEGLDGDIIQFYTDEIINKYLGNVASIREDIYNQIYKKVYGVDKPIDVEEPIDVEDEIKEGTEVTLIPGKKTAAGKQKYKFINDKKNIVELTIKSATDKGFTPATKKDIK